jgi:hypothetical protein
MDLIQYTKAFSIRGDYACLAIYEGTFKVKYDMTLQEAKDYQNKLISNAKSGKVDHSIGRLMKVKIAKNEVIEAEINRILFRGF